MGKMTFSFDKLGIVVQILEGLNPGLDVVPLDNKTIELTKKSMFVEYLHYPKSWEAEERSYGFFLQGGFEESFSYKLLLR